MLLPKFSVSGHQYHCWFGHHVSTSPGSTSPNRSRQLTGPGLVRAGTANVGTMRGEVVGL